MPSSRILPTRRIFGTELTEMKPQLLPRALFHSTSVPKSRNRSTRLYERFGGPAYFTRLRSKPAAVTDALLLQGPAGRVPLPAWELKRCCPPTPASPAVACCQRPRPLPGPRVCSVRRTRRAWRTELRARARGVCGPRSCREASLASAEGCRKLLAPARTYVSANSLPGLATARHLHTMRGGACTPAHACVCGAPAAPASWWHRYKPAIE